MTSGFSYKGINIYQITDNKGSKVPGYNFIGTNTSDTGLRPLPFGLTYQGTPLSNYCTAQTTLYTNTALQTVPIPSGSKSFAFYGIGGGGGPGGKGGNALFYDMDVVNEVAYFTEGPGGSGGTGVKGGYISGYQISNEGQTSLKIIIGTGGNQGADGATNVIDKRFTVGGPDTTIGGSGNSGNAGNSTSIKIFNTTYSTSQADGGNGGNGGTVKANSYSPPTFSKIPGEGGNTPSPNPSPAKINNVNVNFPTSIDGGYGNPGVQGALQIIWLYN